MDKGKIALVTIEKSMSDKKGLVGKIQSTMAIKGLGGFGYKGSGAMGKIPAKPKREPDLVLDA